MIAPIDHPAPPTRPDPLETAFSALSRLDRAILWDLFAKSRSPEAVAVRLDLEVDVVRRRALAALDELRAAYRSADPGPPDAEPPG